MTFRTPRTHLNPGDVHPKDISCCVLSYPAGPNSRPIKPLATLKMLTSSLYRTGPNTGHTGRSRLIRIKTPARCRGQVQLLNLHDQVGLLRNASGFPRFANMHTALSAEVPFSECWLKSNRPPRAGQGQLSIYQKGDLPSRGNDPLSSTIEIGFNPLSKLVHPGFELLRFLEKGNQFISDIQGSEDRNT